jgi:hypothetical protein
MEPEAGSLWSLFGPLIAAYLAACGGLLLALRLRPSLWPPRTPLRTDRKWLDLGAVLVAVVLVLALGQLWRAGWLLPSRDGWPGDMLWQCNNAIIYSPILLVLAVRRQSGRTVYLSLDGLPVKLAAGAVFGMLGVVLFLALRGEAGRLPGVLLASARTESLRNFLPVFLEGVALAFMYVRLRWAFGQWPALLGPGLLFAAAHIPRQLESGLGAPEMIAYFAVTTGIAFAVLYTLDRSRDVIWIGIVHYLMDVAIDAFS